VAVEIVGLDGGLTAGGRGKSDFSPARPLRRIFKDDSPIRIILRDALETLVHQSDYACFSTKPDQPACVIDRLPVFAATISNCRMSWFLESEFRYRF
jgi:hypothetical protein